MIKSLLIIGIVCTSENFEEFKKLQKENPKVEVLWICNKSTHNKNYWVEYFRNKNYLIQ